MHVRNAFLAAAAVILTASPGLTQPAAWSAPVLGYVYDESSNSIKSIAGVPGAASIDGVVPSAVKLQRAHVAPGRKFGVVQTVEEGAALLDWSTGEAVLRRLPGAIANITSVAFSPQGSYAVLLSQSTGKIQLWRGLPDVPALESEIASEATALAVSDDGAIAAVRGDGAYSLDSEEAKLLASGEFSAIAFRPRTRELAAAGRFSDTVVSLRPGGGAVTIASTDDGIAEPVGLQFSGDGAKLVIANLRGRSATIVDLRSQSRATIPCDCNPELVSAAAANGVFRITSAFDAPLVFVDASLSEPRTFMVPATGGSR
jgi:hypothetical protein